MGRNLGRAIASIGDDVLAYSRIRAQEEAVRLRDERERLMMESRERMANARIDAMERRAGGGGAGASTAERREFTDEELSALSDADVPTIAEGRAYNRTRELPKRPAFTVDDEGNAAVDDQGKPLAPMIEDYESRPRIERSAATFRRGLVTSMVDPGKLDDFQKGRTTGAILDTAQRDPEAGRQLARNVAGKDRFSVEGDEKVDEGGASPGFKDQTAQGRAKAVAARELGDLRDRTDPNRPRGGGAGGAGGANAPEYKAEKELLDGVERQLEKANASLATAENNQVNALGESGRKAAQALVDQRRAEVQRLEARAAEHRSRMQRIADGAPRGAPPGEGGSRMPNEAQLRAQANAAISQGADANAVKARFKQMTGKDL